MGTAPKARAVAALQFDLQYDPSVLTIASAAGDATISAGKTLSTHVLSSGRIRFLIAGLNRTVIGDGSVVNLTIQVSASSSVGPYDLNMLNAVGADPTAQVVRVAAYPGRIDRIGPK